MGRLTTFRLRASSTTLYVLAWVEQSGFALRLDSLITAEPWLSRVDSLLLLGTALGVKGQDLAPQACERLAGATAMLGERRARVRLIVDGGIRLQTVPLLRHADADVIVP